MIHLEVEVKDGLLCFGVSISIRKGFGRTTMSLVDQQ